MTKFNYETHGDIPIVDQEYIQTVASVSDISELDITDINNFLNMMEEITND
jgi:hypothetical protein|tara:strand:+ start:1053 stop:1205 length:153 start_codon:yes stop_codon:yes gene_type:complete